MRDAYGNYVVQYIITEGGGEVPKQLIDAIRGNVLELARLK
jgi:hypothetical protein